MENEESIIISKSELNSPYIEDMVLQERAAKRVVNHVGDSKIPAKTEFYLNPVFYTAVAGLLGAIIAWLLSEPNFGILVKIPPGKSENDCLEPMMIMIPAFIGFTISSIDAFVSRNMQKTLRNGGLGLAISLLLGWLGYHIANVFMLLLYGVGHVIFPSEMLKSSIVSSKIPYALYLLQMLSRTPSWVFIGICMGVVPGIVNKSKKMVYNGVIGGILGGFIGGFLFDPMCIIFSGQSGAISRGVGFAFVGLFLGIFVGLIENISKEAWIVMKTGALRGKQFVLYHDVTTVGSSPRCDIYIFKDPKIEPKHAEIHKVGSKFKLVDLGNPEGVYVGGVRVTSKILEKGDIIVVGESAFEFQQKESV